MDSLYKFACRLSNIQRFQGRRLQSNYNVAEHSYRVAIISMRIADDLKTAGCNIIVEDVIKCALLHDIEEAGLGDIPQPYKHYFKNYKCVEIDFLEKEVKLPKKYISLKKLHGSDLVEGRIVKLADMIEAFVTSSYEIERGNVSLRDCYNELYNLIQKYNDIIINSPFAQNVIEKARNDLGY